MENDSLVEIYTDGSCLENPGRGGWGAILIYKGHQKKISGKEAPSTNNRMELRAVIEALRTLKKPMVVRIYTDSQYVKNGITQWIFSWKKNGWKTAARKPVKNVELWQELDIEAALHKIEWCWVRAHAGNYFNELVDVLAKTAAAS
jgi:ribonuclease HI